MRIFSIVLALSFVSITATAQDGPIMRSAMKTTVAASAQATGGVKFEKPSSPGRGLKIAGGILMGLGAYYAVSSLVADNLPNMTQGQQDARQKQWMVMGAVCSGVGVGLYIKGTHLNAAVSPKRTSIVFTKKW